MRARGSHPESAARAYLTVIDGNPEAVEKALVNKPRDAKGIRQKKRPRTGRGDKDVARVCGAHKYKPMYAAPALKNDHLRQFASNSA